LMVFKIVCALPSSAQKKGRYPWCSTSDPREHTPRSSTQELRRQGSSRRPRVPPR
jgi:hypothetical protein